MKKVDKQGTDDKYYTYYNERRSQPWVTRSI